MVVCFVIKASGCPLLYRSLFFRVVFISHDPRKEQRLWFPVPSLKEAGEPGFAFSCSSHSLRCCTHRSTTARTQRSLECLSFTGTRFSGLFSQLYLQLCCISWGPEVCSCAPCTK